MLDYISKQIENYDNFNPKLQLARQIGQLKVISYIVNKRNTFCSDVGLHCRAIESNAFRM